ncbi:MAG: type I phosphomannose isomerase catalytic subunit [Candidatus Kariarchaeaceae archaeon]|jgi:mannose-6-phosphate isomerase
MDFVAYPLLLKPTIKSAAWGSNNLIEKYGKLTPLVNCAESLEISESSKVINGEYKDQFLSEIIKRHREALLSKSELNLTLKYLDCGKSLSLQVHPNKDEGWYILEAKPDSYIWLGLKKGVRTDTFCKCIANGEDPRGFLNRFTPKVGEYYYVPTGVVHALGPGLVVAEIQQNNQTTYRLSDWGRQFGDYKRPLHIKKGLDTISKTPFDVIPGDHSEWDHWYTIHRSSFFSTELFKGTKCLTKSKCAHIVSCVKSKACIYWHNDEAKLFSMRLSQGQTALIPATMPIYKIVGMSGCEVIKIDLRENNG